eukprot:PhF_6_TR38899/c0_g1_i1/m.58183
MESIVQELKTRHAAVIRVSDEDWIHIQGMHDIISNFFRQQSMSVKRCSEFGNGMGFSTSPRGIFEEFIVKVPNESKASPFPWPVAPPTFETIVKRGFDTLHKIGNEVLAAAGLPSNTSDDLHHLQNDEMYSHSVMFCRHYLTLCPELWGGPRGGPGHMEAHTDTGLLTLIPGIETRGLQVLNLNASSATEDKPFQEEWWSVDDSFQEGDKVVVAMVGEALAGITNGHFHAAVHRVRKDLARASVDRLTTPFQLRGAHSALDRASSSASNGKVTKCQMKVLAF